MASIIENLNSVITTKNQLNTILRENGQVGGDVFSDYPEQFRAAIAGAGVSEEAVNSYISSYLDTYNFIDGDELSAMGYVTSSDIPEVDLSSYVTYDYLSAQGYVTSVPVIDENIVPKESGTYTLGDGTYYYANTYSYNYNFGYNTGLNSGSDYEVNMKVNGSNNFQWNMYQFYMMNDKYRNNCSLGTAVLPWAYTYTNNIWFSNINSIRGSQYTLGLYLNGTNRTTFTTTGIRPSTNDAASLGTSDYNWSYTYTYNLILNGTNIEDRFTYLMWVGTSAEYAALSDYTSYQIYLIQEA